MEPIVIPSEVRYAEGFHRCLDGVARERKYLIFEEAPPIESTTAFIKDVLANGHLQFLALAGDEVVGWVDILRHGRRAVSHGGALGIGIAAGHRGRGLGRRLMTAAMDAAGPAGFTRVELGVLHTNTNAIRLYEKLGFVHEGVSKRSVRLDGVYYDQLRMAWFP